MAQIKMFPHYRELVERPQDYPMKLHDVSQQVFADEPWGQLAAQMALQAGAASDVTLVTDALALLAESGMDEIAEHELKRLVQLENPETRTLECHLFPCLHPDRRGGFCFAPGKMLILIPLMDLWEKRLVRNICHEYSHTLRMTKWPLDERHGFGPTFRYTVREHLVFEGLAENLVEEMHPDPKDFPVEQVTEGEERRFWEAISPHFNKENWDAYGVLMNPAAGLPRRIGYIVGSRIVRSYLRRHGMSALSAHQLPYGELYWNSEYTSIR